MRFDLSKYSTVAERLAQFHRDYPDGRIITKLVKDYSVDGPRTWVFKASVYLTAGDHAAGIPKATGYASEIDGTGGANNGSACENAESSSVGRALMLAGYSVSKDPKTLASAEEMSKLNRIADTDWLGLADTLTDVDELRQHYARAKASGVHPEVLERIKERALAVSGSSSVSGGTEGSVSEVSGSADGGKVSAKPSSGSKAGGGK